MLRTLPDDTHASLQRRLTGPDSPVVLIQDKAMSQGHVTNATIHGTLNICTEHDEGLTQTRTIFTCVHAPTVIDLCQLTNTSSQTCVVTVKPWRTTEKTDPKKGRLGTYVIEQFLMGDTRQALASGESLTYALVYCARLENEPPYFGEPQAELAARRQFIETRYVC